jgi:hypothetical protein
MRTGERGKGIPNLRSGNEEHYIVLPNSFRSSFENSHQIWYVHSDTPSSVSTNLNSTRCDPVEVNRTETGWSGDRALQFSNCRSNL